ncbi:MAG: 50S ribosomal protein L27 [Parcubacteria group bacterium CG1_02_44_31]|nr:MAG: 50S ribosomal protein L27 [Parcubacteria group bacterium CG1_02_44_31]
MAHTKAGGSTKLGRDSGPKYLGVKVSDGQTIRAGEIIIRQRGTHYHAGIGSKKGSDDTIYAMKQGRVKFTSKMVRRFDDSRKQRVTVQVL